MHRSPDVRSLALWHINLTVSGFPAIGVHAISTAAASVALGAAHILAALTNTNNAGRGRTQTFACAQRLVGNCTTPLIFLVARAEHYLFDPYLRLDSRDAT